MGTTQMLNRSDPEALYFTVTNAEGAQLTNGDCVEWDPDGTAGVSVELTDAVASALVCGVITETIDTSGVGVAQHWGYHAAVKTTTTATAGECVQADTSGKCRNFAPSGTELYVNATTAKELQSIIGVVHALVSTTVSGVYLRL